jgi:hypothetical protein
MESDESNERTHHTHNQTIFSEEFLEESNVSMLGAFRLPGFRVFESHFNIDLSAQQNVHAELSNIG